MLLICSQYFYEHVYQTLLCSIQQGMGKFMPNMMTLANHTLHSVQALGGHMQHCVGIAALHNLSVSARAAQV